MKKIHLYLAFIKNTLKQNFLFLRETIKAVNNKIEYNKRNIMLICHALEKGMIYENKHFGWGEKKAFELLNIIKSIKIINPLYDYEIEYALNVLRTYIENKTQEPDINSNLTFIEITYKKLIEELSPKVVKAGFLNVSNDQLCNHINNFEFEQFLRTRHSIRFFSDKIVNSDVINCAIGMAQLCPSACNRQPSKVYYSSDNETNNELRTFFSNSYDFSGTKPNFMIITSNMSLFSSDEYLQPFINTGMYVSTLIYALHSLNVGCCCIEYNAYKDKSEKNLRKLLSIPQNEVIVAALSYGWPRNDNLCTVGFRRSPESVVINNSICT